MASTDDLSHDDDWRQRAASIMTTEHFTLQSARSATISDSSGRASLFLGSVSASLVALGLFATATGVGTGFRVFTLVLFPVLLFLGLVTFNRVAQSAVEDLLYAHGINRVRRFYLDAVPEAAPYFILSANDDAAGVLRNMGIAPSPWQPFLTTAGTIGVIDSVLAAVFVGFAADLFGLPLGPAVAVGALVFVLSVVAHYRAEGAMFERSGGQTEVRFPSPGGSGDPEAEAAVASRTTRA